MTLIATLAFSPNSAGVRRNDFHDAIESRGIWLEKTPALLVRNRPSINRKRISVAPSHERVRRIFRDLI